MPTAGQPRRGLLVAAIATAICAPAPAASAGDACTGAGRMAGAGDQERVRVAIACLINAERRARGIREVSGERRLRSAAERHASDMVRRGYFAHRSPGGGDLRDRLRAAGYGGRARAWWAGEILAWGTAHRSTPEAVVTAWLASPPHRDVMLDPRFDEVGVGVEPGTPRSAREGGITVAAELGRTG
jgi:uncharacterized protein YkwD